MIRLYVALATVVLVLSLAAGFLAYEVKKTDSSVASCSFRIDIPLTDHSTATDSLNFTNASASGLVTRATLAGAPALGAVSIGVPASAAADVSVQPVIGSTYRAAATNGKADVAIKLANAVCASYVAQIQADIDGQQQADQTAISGRIDKIQTALAQLPPTGLTPAQQSQARVLQLALTRSEALLAQAMTIVPFTATTTSEAQAAAPESSTSVGVYLLVAAVSALLLTFLLILVNESVEIAAANRLARKLQGREESEQPAIAGVV